MTWALLWKGRPPSDSAWIRLFCTRYRLLFRSDWLLGPLPPGSAGRQPALGYLQVGQAQQHGQPFRVLSQTPIAHLGVVEASLHVRKGCSTLALMEALTPLRPSRQTPPVPASAAAPAALPPASPLLTPGSPPVSALPYTSVTHTCNSCRAADGAPRSRHGRGRGGSHAMHQARLGVHPRCSFIRSGYWFPFFT